ncbi:hypothetical protein JCM3770_000945 [Rhodotorula araucariae]
MVAGADVDSTDEVIKAGRSTTSDQDKLSNGTSLLDLPDELISRIFDLPRVCKRLHAIAAPHRYRAVEFPEIFDDPFDLSDEGSHVRDMALASDMDKCCATVVGRKEALAYVRNVNFGSTRAPPLTRLEILASSTHLRSFRITIEDESFWTSEADERLVRLLRALASLDTLGYDEPSKGLLDLPDELLTVIFRYIYILERDEKRTGTAVTLDRIRINKRIRRIAFPLFLDHLHFPSFMRKNTSSDTCFGGLAAVSRNEPLPLATFELGMHSSFEVGTPEYDERQAVRLRLLHTVLVLADATQLVLTGFASLPFFYAAEVFPSVRRLDLQGSAELWLTDNLEGIRSLLGCLPRLDQLALTSFFFHAENTTLVAEYGQLPFAAFGLRYPAFAALLTFVRTTSVLDFQYKPEWPPVELRCTRASRDDDFDAEVIWMMRR